MFVNGIKTRTIQYVRGVNMQQIGRITFGPDPKKKTYRNAAYLDYVRTLPCLFCQRWGPSDPHHISMSDAGFGMKSSDLGVIPLCREHHRLFHDNPEMCRETVDGSELYEAMYWQLRKWITKEAT